MNQHSKQFRRVLLESNLEIGLDVMHARQWQIVGKRAVA
jgi:hypothetical protein